MSLEILTIITPIFVCALIGYVWARSGIPFDNDFVTRLVASIGAPCLIVGTLGKVAIPTDDFITIILASASVMLLSAICAYIICRLFSLSVRTYLTPLCFPNTGNIGLPLALFAFGDEGLAIGLGIFVVMSLTHFTIGIAVVSGNTSWRDTLKSPLVISGVIAALLIFTGWQLPTAIENTLLLIGDLSIPLMLITLGVSLSQLQVKDVTVSISLGLARLIIGIGAGLLVAELLNLEGVLRGALIIQASMPAAIFNYLLARKFNRAPEAVAGLVVVSTLAGFILMPFILWLVL